MMLNNLFNKKTICLMLILLASCKPSVISKGLTQNKDHKITDCNITHTCQAIDCNITHTCPVIDCNITHTCPVTDCNITHTCPVTDCNVTHTCPVTDCNVTHTCPVIDCNIAHTCPVIDCNIAHTCPVIDCNITHTCPQPNTILPILNQNMWLHTYSKTITTVSKNAPGLYLKNGNRWFGKGAVITDARSCDKCTFNTTSLSSKEAIGLIDELVDHWHANFIRLVLSSYNSPTQGLDMNVVTIPRVSWQSLLLDQDYLDSIKEIVDHISTKKNVYVMLSLWRDASFDDNLMPSIDSMSAPGSLCATTKTITTNCTWKKLASVFNAYPYVFYNLDAEPVMEGAVTDAQQADLLHTLDAIALTIRNVEKNAGVPQHIITVPGLRAFARSLAYYASQDQKTGLPILHTLQTSNGNNIVYDAHPYDPSKNFTSDFLYASKYLPVIVGEFGPFIMDGNDCMALVQQTTQLQIPYIAWAFHPNCGGLSLLSDINDVPGAICTGNNLTSLETAGPIMVPLSSTGKQTSFGWAQWLKSQLATPLPPPIAH